VATGLGLVLGTLVAAMAPVPAKQPQGCMAQEQAPEHAQELGVVSEQVSLW